jgi:two-component sensor histidine kinase
MPALVTLTSTVVSLNEELRSAGDGLVGNVDVLRAVLAGCGDCIKILDLDGRLQFMSEGGKRVMEVDDFSALKGCPWPDLWAGAGNADAVKAVEAARQGKVARFTGAADTARGNSRYWDVQVSPIFGDDGKPSHILSISRDITAERRAQAELTEANERQKTLAEELQHRIKNTLAMVGAIANQTMRGDSVEKARDAFNARLVTLSRAHDILTQTSWISASIKDVVEGALAPHRMGQGRIEVSGQELLLQPKQALAIALAVHELATNAVKYGSLSNAAGKVHVAWSTDVTADVPTFRFTWTETGGPAVVEPTQSEKGFGSRLIERTLKNDFGGVVSITYNEDGVACELAAPLANILSEPA